VCWNGVVNKTVLCVWNGLEAIRAKFLIDGLCNGVLLTVIQNQTLLLFDGMMPK
jgi:hypothetical protein